MHTFLKEAPSVDNKQRQGAVAGAPSPFHCANPPAAARDTKPAWRRLYAALLSTLPSVAIGLLRGNSSLCLCLLCLALPSDVIFYDVCCEEFNPDPLLTIFSTGFPPMCAHKLLFTVEGRPEPCRLRLEDSGYLARASTRYSPGRSARAERVSTPVA